MMLYAFYLSIRDGLELTHRSEIEDAAEMIFLFEPLDVRIACIVQVRSAKQSMRTDGPSSGPGDTAKVAGIIYMIKNDFQCKLSVISRQHSVFFSKDFVDESGELFVSEGVGQLREGVCKSAVVPFV